MAATTLEGIMDGIAGQLALITSLNVNVPLTDADMPVALIGLPRIDDYHGTSRHGFFELEPTIVVFVEKQISQVGLRQLAAYADIAGANSIHLAIEADRSLGGAVDDCIVASFAPLSQADIDRYGFVGGLFTLKCAARGS